MKQLKMNGYYQLKLKNYLNNNTTNRQQIIYNNNIELVGETKGNKMHPRHDSINVVGKQWKQT